jgi:hypothetical protein
MAWVNTYREESVPMAGAVGGTITNHSPGKRIAKAITEIQDKAVTDVVVTTDGAIGASVEVINNVLQLALSVIAPPSVPLGSVDPVILGGSSGSQVSGFSGSIQLVGGVRYNQNARSFEVLTRTLSVDNGLVKSSSDGEWLAFLTLRPFAC